MILSTQTDRTFRVFGEEEGLKLLAQAGYDAVDFSMFDMKNADCRWNTCDLVSEAEKLRRTAEAVGLRFNQAHAPFPSFQPGGFDYNLHIQEYLERSIRIAGILGAKAIIVHPIAYPGGEPVQKEFNLNFYRKLEPVALKAGIRVALENMWGYDSKRGYIVPNVCSFGEDLASYYDELNPEAFTVCLDVGHSSLVGDEAGHAIRVLGKNRLGALHIHDNDYKHDSHTIPYDRSASMDWDDITKALGEIDYQGDFTFEADNFLARFDRAAMPAAMRFMADLGRTLTAKIDAARPHA